jgi:hypothetical protein
MARAIVDPAQAHLRWEWGMQLAAHAVLLDLEPADVARLVGLGDRLTEDDVAQAFRGEATLEVLGEITEALDLGARITLVPAAELAHEWGDLEMAKERLRRSRALRAGWPAR